MNYYCPCLNGGTCVCEDTNFTGEDIRCICPEGNYSYEPTNTCIIISIHNKHYFQCR